MKSVELMRISDYNKYSQSYTHSMQHAGEISCGPCEMNTVAVEKYTLKDGIIIRDYV